ncbi:MAG: glycosyltransferase family 4 protein [Acidobacteria bacterium]|nr:glycosyltransferase family 4 protein [Acidobacteriota bacterium]
MNIVTFTSLFPNREQPNFGVFVKHRSLALASHANVRVVAPVPYFPKSLNFNFVPAHWRRLASLPEQEEIAGLPTWHPRYFNPPKVGMTQYARWMANGALATVAKLHREQPIDLIDAHYVYPDGAAAMRIGQALNIPVSLSARGTDINLFSTMPLIRPRIQQALQSAQAIVAVSAALKQRMIELSIPDEKIAVIRNGIDAQFFYPRDRAAARAKLGLPREAKIILTVGALVPLKGIDRLIDAMPSLDARLYVIGQGPERESLQAHIAAHGHSERISLVGAKPQTELGDWYAAADVFALASHREGCPNVVVEALACGTPVVASDVGGINELVTDDRFGLLVPADETNAQGFAARLQTALQKDWSRDVIAVSGGARSWDDVAREVLKYWQARGLG